MSADGDYSRFMQSVGEALAERFKSAGQEGGWDDKWNMEHRAQDVLEAAAGLLKQADRERTAYIWGEELVYTDQERRQTQYWESVLFGSPEESAY